MADRIDQTAPLNADQADQRRPLTYPLVGGGSLEAAIRALLAQQLGASA